MSINVRRTTVDISIADRRSTEDIGITQLLKGYHGSFSGPRPLTILISMIFFRKLHTYGV